MEIFCFAMGILFVFTLNLHLLLALLFFYFICPRYSLILFFVVGMVVSGIHQWLNWPQGMPDLAVIPQAWVQGTICSIPVQTKHKTTFTFAIERLNGKAAQSLVQLTWYDRAPALHPGQVWQLQVKLKKPRNFLNPGSSDFLGALKSRHIAWTGYVFSQGNVNMGEAHSQFELLKLRERLGNNLIRQAPDEQAAGVLEALTLNLNTHISQDNWELFRRTGTIHLFGISGEHIALISGLVFFLIQWLWSRSMRLCLCLPASYPASLGGLAVAFVYSLLAGFAPPVQRALIGCFFYTLCCVGKKKFSAWQIWRYALVGVLCFEPHAVFMQGFYFSFIAVACLLLTHQRWSFKGWKQTLALQAACLIGLMPLSLYWFSYGSINGFVANLFAIPLVGFLIVPLALLALFFSTWGGSGLLIQLLSWLIAILFKGLIWTEKLASLNITHTLPSITQVICLMGALLLWIALPIKPFQGFALLWFLIPWLPSKPLLHPGEALIQVLDVGQGLSISIRTAHHVLLYDTGDQFFQGSDLGQMVVLPFLKAMNIHKIDAIVISHPDKDHRGGLKSIQKNLPVDQLIVNDRHYYEEGLICHQHPTWQWDGVTFRFFSIQMPFQNKNNSSCILQISTSHGKALFTGDIEAAAEDYLIKTYGSLLKSQVLMVPHHGSKTSSTYRFLMEVAPKYAIASLGFDNRFHFPHANTLNNLSSLGIDFYRTDECGMVEVLLPAKGKVKTPQCYREQSLTSGRFALHKVQNYTFK